MTLEQYKSVVADLNLTAKYFTWRIKNGEGTDEEYFIVSLGDTVEPKILALMECNGIDYGDADALIENGEYLVYTQLEADEASEAEAIYYLEEIALPEVPEYMRQYIDEDEYIRDFLQDDNAHILGRHDGVENSETIYGTEYFIYRQ